MKNTNVLILGYFGYKTNKLDGQTVKTRNVHSLLKSKLHHGYEVDYFDTEILKSSKLHLGTLILKLYRADSIFYLPAHNSLKYLFPFVWLLSKLSNSNLNYIVIGGWLLNFLDKNPMHLFLLARVSQIFVETNTLCVGLKRLNFKNVSKLHNFRLDNIPLINSNKPQHPEDLVKFVFMARIHPGKGTELLFLIDEKLRKKGIDKFQLDIYGPIEKDYEQRFLSKLNSSLVSYKGVLAPTEIQNTLKNYDLLLFPTKFYTEGFPGTILDANASGLPVIATAWLNAYEFIQDGITGFITPFGDDDLFLKKVEYVINNPKVVYNMKSKINHQKDKYSAEKAWDILKKYL